MSHICLNLRAQSIFFTDWISLGPRAVWPTKSPKHSGGPQMGKMKVDVEAASAS